jgi:hypothetical protein
MAFCSVKRNGELLIELLPDMEPLEYISKSLDWNILVRDTLVIPVLTLILPRGHPQPDLSPA